MASPASTDDLADRWRPLSGQEETNGEVFLADAWRMLRRRIAGLEAAVAADVDGDLTAEVVRVQCGAVLRVLKNPDGKRQESIDDYTWQRDRSVSAGLLYFTDDEVTALVIDPSTRGGAFSFSLLPASYPSSRFPA